MALNPEHEQRFRNHLEKIGAKACPICAHGEWEVGLMGDLRVIGRVCTACGYLQYFDLRPIGLRMEKGPHLVEW